MQEKIRMLFFPLEDDKWDVIFAEEEGFKEEFPQGSPIFEENVPEGSRVYYYGCSKDADKYILQAGILRKITEDPCEDEEEMQERRQQFVEALHKEGKEIPSVPVEDYKHLLELPKREVKKEIVEKFEYGAHRAVMVDGKITPIEELPDWVGERKGIHCTVRYSIGARVNLVFCCPKCNRKFEKGPYTEKPFKDVEDLSAHWLKIRGLINNLHLPNGEAVKLCDDCMRDIDYHYCNFCTERHLAADGLTFKVGSGFSSRNEFVCSSCLKKWEGSFKEFINTLSERDGGI